jgi:hypothetical protein
MKKLILSIMLHPAVLLFGLMLIGYATSARAQEAPAGYTKCADEGSKCSFKDGGAHHILFGINGAKGNVEKDVTGTFKCTAKTFGAGTMNAGKRMCFYHPAAADLPGGRGGKK